MAVGYIAPSTFGCAPLPLATPTTLGMSTRLATSTTTTRATRIAGAPTVSLGLYGLYII